MRIKVKNNKELTNTIKELREKGFMLITYGKGFAELEKDNKYIIIEK